MKIKPRAYYFCFINYCVYNIIYNIIFIAVTAMVEINYWTNRKICAKVAFPRYTESVKFRSQSRERASKRKPYRGLGTR